MYHIFIISSFSLYVNISIECFIFHYFLLTYMIKISLYGIISLLFVSYAAHRE